MATFYFQLYQSIKLYLSIISKVLALLYYNFSKVLPLLCTYMRTILCINATMLQK